MGFILSSTKEQMSRRKILNLTSDPAKDNCLECHTFATFSYVSDLLFVNLLSMRTPLLYSDMHGIGD